jgi:hypothetical protein
VSTETLAENQTETAKPEPVATAEPGTPRRWPIEGTITAWIFVAAGAFFRIKAFIHWRSLWLDEIYLAHSVIHRGLYQLLFEPLDYWQTAPPGFLILEKICVLLLGTGERALRLPALLAGLAALPLFLALARRVLTVRGTLLAVLLFNCLAPLVYYSEEAKQYSLDVAAGLAIMLAAVNCYQNPQTRRNWWWYFGAGFIGLFFSHPAVFVLAGTWLVLLSRRVELSRLLAMGVVLGAWEGAIYYLFMRPVTHGPGYAGLLKDWLAAGGFPPWQPNHAAGWIWNSFRHILEGYSTMYLDAPDLGMLLAVVGLAALIVRQRPLGLLVIAPLPLALLAAFLHKYPFVDRVTLYVVPIMTLLVAGGIDELWGEQGFGRAGMALLASAILIGPAVCRVGYDSRWPRGREESEQAYQWVRKNWRDGDALMLSTYAAWSFDHYAGVSGMAGLEQLPVGGGTLEHPLESSKQGLSDATIPQAAGYVILQPDHPGNAALYLDDMDHLFNPPAEWGWPKITRVWVVFVHDWDEQTEKICLPELDRKARLEIRHGEDGAAVYLYEVSDVPSAYMRQ